MPSYWFGLLRATPVARQRAAVRALLCLCTAVAAPLAAETPPPDDAGRPIVRNYDYRDFGAEAQTWGVLQGDTGLMYFANNAGVIEYDGRTWRLIELPAHGAVRSLTIEPGGGRIYVGGQGDVGYLAPDGSGQLQFTSLLPADEKRDPRFTGLIHPVVTPSGVYFHLRRSVCRWSDGQLRCRETGSNLSGIYHAADQTYVHQRGAGLMQVIDSSITPVPGGSRFADEEITLLLSFRARGQNRLLVGTRTFGLYLQHGSGFEPFGSGIADPAGEDQLETGTVLADGTLALGTRRRGVLIVGRDGTVRQQIDRATGLQDNHVHGIWLDRHGGLWLALQHGVSRVELGSPYTIFDESSGLEREWREVLRHRDTLYVRGYKGLYASSASRPRNEDGLPRPGAPSLHFRRIAELEAPVWAIADVGHALLASSRDGVYAVEGGRPRRIATYASMPMGLYASRSDPGRVFVGLADGLGLLRYANGSWIDEGRVGGIDEGVTSMAEGPGGDLWLVGQQLRALRVRFRGLGGPAGRGASRRQPTEVRRFDTEAMIGRIQVRTIAGRPVFLSETGIFEFDARAERFVPVRSLAVLAAEGRRSFSWIAEDLHGNVWVASRKPGGVDFLWKQPDGSYLLDSAGLRQGFAWSIYPDPQRNLVWFATPDHLLRYDPATRSDARRSFRTLVRQVLANGTEVVFGGAARPGVAAADGDAAPSPPVQLPATARSLRFEFGAGSYEAAERNEFQSYLEGFDRNWSAWSQDATRTYTNLKPGEYRLHVRARDVEGRAGEEAEFAFGIRPPWYRSAAAYLLYVSLSILALVLAAHTARKRTQQKLRHEREHLELEQLREIDRVKSQFFADVSHEFRTPLSLILGPATRMLDGPTTPEARQHLELIRRHAEYLMRLISQVLDLSTLESRKMPLRATPGDLAHELCTIVAPFATAAEARGIRIHLDAPAGRTSACFDRDVLEKIINNLLSNALKFTPAGGTITVSLAWPDGAAPGSPRPADAVELSVADTGIGIPPAHLPRIFERFYQVRGGAAREGFGIGLALVKELVELHGGSVTVESDVGRGTTFTVRLPIATDRPRAEEPARDLPVVELPQSPPALPAPVPAAAAVAKADERASVLVVEDHADMRGFLRDQLQPYYRVIEAADGAEGLRQATAHLPALVLSDVMMGGLDGYRLCHELKTDERTCHIPVVLLTARAGREDRLRGLDTGADCYLVKPFDPPELLAQIRNLLDQRRLLRQRFSRSVVLKPSEMAVIPADQAFLAKVLAVIESNLENPKFDVEDLGHAVGLSRSQLHRKLRTLTNQPPTMMIRSVRLQRAAELLARQAGSVSEIAYRVGFNSQAYFAKCFREEFGVSPKEHRTTSKELTPATARGAATHAAPGNGGNTAGMAVHGARGRGTDGNGRDGKGRDGNGRDGNGTGSTGTGPGERPAAGPSPRVQHG
jgi:signal transduction histidine kinase/DNA-binding response OmpR family regulator